MFQMPLLQNYRKDGANSLGVSGIKLENDFLRINHNGTVRMLYHTYWEGDRNYPRDIQVGDYVNSGGVRGGCYSFVISFWAYYINGDSTIDFAVPSYEAGFGRSYIKINNGSVTMVGREVDDGFYPLDPDEAAQIRTWTVSQNANSWHHYCIHARNNSDGTQDITLYYDGSSRGTFTAQPTAGKVVLTTYYLLLVGSNSWQTGNGVILGVRSDQHTNYPYAIDSGLYTTVTSPGPAVGKLPGRIKNIPQGGDTPQGVNAGFYQLGIWWKHGVDANWMPLEDNNYRAKLFNGGARDLGSDGTLTGLPQPQIYLRGNDGSDLADGGSLSGTKIRTYNNGSEAGEYNTADTSDNWRWHEYAEVTPWVSQVHQPQGYWIKSSPQSGDTFI